MNYNIYKETLTRIESFGHQFKINLEERTLTVNKKDIIKNGSFSDDHKLGIDIPDNVSEMLEEMSRRFLMFQYSKIGAKTSRKMYKYFQPLSADKLSEEDVLFAEDRTIAQFKLEYYVLAAIITGKLTPESLNMGDKFFWKDWRTAMRIKKDWIINHNTNN